MDEADEESFYPSHPPLPLFYPIYPTLPFQQNHGPARRNSMVLNATIQQQQHYPVMLSKHQSIYCASPDGSFQPYALVPLTVAPLMTYSSTTCVQQRSFENSNFTPSTPSTNSNAESNTESSTEVAADPTFLKPPVFMVFVESSKFKAKN